MEARARSKVVVPAVLEGAPSWGLMFNLPFFEMTCVSCPQEL